MRQCRKIRGGTIYGCTDCKNTVKEGLQQEFLKLAKEMTVKTRQKKGCISYDLASDQSDAQVFYFIEKYQDEKAVEFHRATEYFKP